VGAVLLVVAVQSVVPAPGFFGAGLPLDARWRLLEATPRIISTSGTATAVVIGQRDNELYLLTAEHAVRKAKDLKLEFFERATYPKVARTVRFGAVLDDFRVPDLAILKFPVGDQAFREVAIAPPGGRPKRFPADGMAIGCTNGKPPTAEAIAITGKRFVRFNGDQEVALFWETEQVSVYGRSGGPLFDGTGRLIGICSATTDGKGYYVHLDEVLVALKQSQHGWLAGSGPVEKEKKR